MTKLEWMRADFKMNVSLLSLHSSVPEIVILRFEAGIAYPDIAQMMSIALVFGVKPDRIFGQDWEKKASPMTIEVKSKKVKEDFPAETNQPDVGFEV